MLALIGYIFTFVLGTIIGSFLNVVILRYHTGETLHGRSRCLSCRATLQPIDLIPIVSFISTRGRCRYCGSKISYQYPVVELLTGIIFALLWWRFSGSPIEFLLMAVAASLLVVITVYDIHHQIIPDELVFYFGVVGLLAPIFHALVTGSLALLVIGFLHSLLTGGIFFLAFWGLWRLSGGRWIGLGDAKLSFGIGTLLGLAKGLTALLTGFWLGAIIGLLLLLASRFKLKKLDHYFTLKSELPFAPFLVIGLLLVLIFNLNVIPL